MQRATQADAAAIDGFLASHIETSMFPLSNLRTHGLDGAHPRAISVWIDPETGGMLAVTREGMILPQLPGFKDWARLKPLLLDRSLIGCLGETDQVRALLMACGLQDRQMNNDSDEPLMRMDLDDLTEQEGEGRLLPLAVASRELIESWRTAYHLEVMGTPADQAEALARRDIESYISADTHRVLVIEDVPVAMTGFNAVCGDVIQIGGVYTPPELRQRGYAGRALHLHLAEAARSGKARAILFAASEAAAGVYRRTGFEIIGSYSMCLFRDPERIG
ncbi:GNAT family N-acetyltransferase [Ruegeria sp. 2205SS24-7]|uniref:GNAT family N-acetyltransferase n=1 Tax=Ruegeria discodermiae TaxID=3064389 RepID=UPI002742658A|nr:GNAT family N-acetyltransferase [Ruegeria sp. 2205SS24-7]MDP5217520.1 GNAT family N-acetyltransferase [Ruegeria sp. 2205SS24-7]